MNKRLLDKILSEVSLDKRVSNGMFNVEEDIHMEALRDYFIKKGIDEESVKSFSNKVLEGKYPERQAYNAKGILVTFPTPEYKAEAIKRGTHFEKPTKGASNLFSEPGTSPKPTSPPKATPTTPTPDKSEPKTNLPVSQAPPTDDSTSDTTTTQAQTTAAPQQTPVSTPEDMPIKEPNELPPPQPKSTPEKEADKNAIKTMLKGDDYMLERIVEFVLKSGDSMIIEQMISRLLKNKYER